MKFYQGSQWERVEISDLGIRVKRENSETMPINTFEELFFSKF